MSYYIKVAYKPILNVRNGSEITWDNSEWNGIYMEKIKKI